MIVTLTLNPSLDRTVEVPRLVPGDGHPGHRRRTVDPGGKGVNVLAGTARQRACPRGAVLPVGGPTGDQLVRAASRPRASTSPRSRSRGDPLEHHPQRARRHRHQDQRAGGRAAVGRRDRRARRRGACGHRRTADWVVPERQPAARRRRRLLRTLVRRLVAAGIDGRGRHRRAGPARGRRCRPDAGQAQPRRARRGASARRLAVARRCRRGRRSSCAPGGLGAVLASLGSDGALLVDGGRRRAAATAPVDEPRSTVGAGDCLLAGFLAAGAEAPRRRSPTASALGRRRRRASGQPRCRHRTRSHRAAVHLHELATRSVDPTR